MAGRSAKAELSHIFRRFSFAERRRSLSKNPELAAVARKQRFAAHPAMRGGLRTAVALRAVLVLGAAHP